MPKAMKCNDFRGREGLCFASRPDKYCEALSHTFRAGIPCPFYKTPMQHRKDLVQAAALLERRKKWPSKSL